MLATIALVGLVAALAWPRGGGGAVEQLTSLAAALGIGAVAWWLVSAVGLNLLYEGRTDHLAWAFALFGLVFLARDSTRSRVAALVLLSAAFWAKQTTLVVSIAAAIWMFAGAALGAWGWRRALGWCGALLVVNLAVLGLLSLITDGWIFYFVFELGLDHPKVSTFGDYAREELRAIGVALLLPLAVAAGVVLDHLREGVRLRTARRLRTSFDARVVSLLVVFVVIGFPAAVYFRTQLGGDTNQYIGVGWALGMLLAVGYRRAGETPRAALVAAGALTAAFVLAVAPGGKLAGMNVAQAGQDREFPELPASWLALAKDNLVYEQVHSDLNVEPQGSVYPNLYNWADLLSVGRQPWYLVGALLERRFDVVKPITFASPRELLFWDIYASGNGSQESGYIWKLNKVIEAGYAPAPGLPPGFLARRPGPNEAAALRDCFGPFELGGRDWEIRDGGGLWCRDGAGAIELRETPAPVTELHTEDPVDELTGTIEVTLPRGRFEIRLRGDGDSRWKLRGMRRGRELELRTSLDGEAGDRVAVRSAADESVTLEFGGAGALRAAGTVVTVPVPDVGSGNVSVYATRGSEARFAF
jgi:hypothetical protein